MSSLDPKNLIPQPNPQGPTPPNPTQTGADTKIMGATTSPTSLSDIPGDVFWEAGVVTITTAYEPAALPAAAIDGPFIRPRTNLELGLGPTEGFDQGTHQHLLTHNHQPSGGLMKEIKRNISVRRKLLFERLKAPKHPNPVPLPSVQIIHHMVSWFL